MIGAKPALPHALLTLGLPAACWMSVMLVQSSVVRPASVSTPSFDLCLSHSFFPPLLSLLSSSQSSNNSPGLTLTLFLISTFCLLFLLWKPSPRVLPAHTVHSHTSLLLYRSSSFSISRDRALFPHLLSSPCSCLPCYLRLSCFCILAHLPSFCLWLFCKLPHFLSLCLIPSFSFSPSCLPLRQPKYDNVISHSTTSPPSPAALPLSFCLVSLSLADSAALHVSLPVLL